MALPLAPQGGPAGPTWLPETPCAWGLGCTSALGDVGRGMLGTWRWEGGGTQGLLLFPPPGGSRKASDEAQSLSPFHSALHHGGYAFAECGKGAAGAPEEELL